MKFTGNSRQGIGYDRNNFNITSILKQIALGILVTLSVGSCATVTQPPGPELGPAPFPSYTKGATFVYSDGRWETVTATSSGVVTWSDYRGLVSSGSPDFTYRPTKWQTQTRSVTRQFGLRADLLAKSTATLWPLRVGNKADYAETGTWLEKDGTESSYRTEWSCAVDGTERVAVMAGDFDTFKIVCKRYYISRNKNRSNIREAKTWYYAPEVGHYVLTTSKYYSEKKPRRKELLAVLPPLNGISVRARRQMERSFQQALEHRKSGQSVRWSSAKLRASLETMPTKTFKAPDGSYSRRYVQKLTLSDGQRTYYGMAVRGSDGVWTIPRR